MGLLDILKNETLNTLVDKLEETIENRTGEPVDLNGSDAPAPAPASGGWQSAEATSAGAPAAPRRPAANLQLINAPVNPAASQQFDRLLAANFSDYEIRQQADAASLGLASAAPCRPYSYVLLRDNRPVLAILLTPHNKTNNASFKNALDAARQAGLPCLNFFDFMANADDYVLQRLRSAI